MLPTGKANVKGVDWAESFKSSLQHSFYGVSVGALLIENFSQLFLEATV